jgi:hypothetical protein
MKDVYRRGILLDEPDEAKLRRKDPVRSTGPAIREQHLNAPMTREELTAKLAKLAQVASEVMESLAPATPAPATAPAPPHVPRPPPPQLQWNEKTRQWEIPCTLSAAELSSSMPSEWTLRCWRRAQEKFEAEQKAQKPDRPGQLMFDPITHKLVRRVSHG